MAQRRDRTTAIPRPKPRAEAAAARKVLGITWGEREVRFSILGAAVAVLLAIIGFISYDYYDENVRRPNSTILDVDGDKYSLSYFTDRFKAFARANRGQQTSADLLAEDLYNNLVREGVIQILAREAGITLTDEEVLRYIGEQLGAAPAGAGSAFDTLYRNQLRTLNIGDGAYKRQKRAEAANDRLLEKLTADLGANGEQLTLRTVLVSTKEQADDIFKRIQGGADMGSIAQAESADLESRQEDGILPSEPRELFPAPIRDALQGKDTGALLEPIQVGNNWWIVRIEKKEEAPYTPSQRSQLAQQRLDRSVEDKKAALGAKIKRSFGADEIQWALDRLN